MQWPKTVPCLYLKAIEGEEGMFRTAFALVPNPVHEWCGQRLIGACSKAEVLLVGVKAKIKD